MVASLVYYGKTVKGLDFTYLSPLNEMDPSGQCLQSPCVDSTQNTTILHALSDELNYMGITDVRFVAPDTALISTSAGYIAPMMADSTIAARTDHLSLHDYSGAPVSPGTAYSGKNYWLTETSAPCWTCDVASSGPPDEWIFDKQTIDIILGDLNNGFPAALIWEGYDSFWYIFNVSSLWGLLAYDQSTGIYTPRKRAYANVQFNHFIGPGDVVIGSTNSISGVPTTVAVYNATTGKLAIVGRNSGTSSTTINGKLSNLPAVNTLALYETTASANLARRSDIPVAAGGTFTAQISADAIFTLTNQPITFDLDPPTVAIASPLNGTQVSGTIEVVANASDNNMVAGVQFVLDGASFGQEFVASPYSISMDTTTLANGGHTLSAIARDPAGNETLSPSVSFTVNNGGSPSPTISLVQKASNVSTSALSLATTLSSSVTSGNLIVVSVSGWPNLPAATPVTDSLGNTYSIAGNVLVSNGAYSAIYYAKNVRAGTDTVTVNTVKTGGQISMVVAEFSGVDTLSPLDRTAGTVGSGTAPSSGTMTPTLSGELVIGSGTHNGSTITSSGTGFSMIAIATEDSNTHQPLAMEYKVLSDAAQTSSTFSLASGYPWTQNGTLFKTASPPHTLSSITVTPIVPTISTGATQQFTATGTYSDGSTQNVTSQVTWTSSNTGVATITSTGLAMGVSAGSSTIMATLSGVNGSTGLTVVPLLTITTTSFPGATLNSAYSATLTASGGVPPYTWVVAGGTLPSGLLLNSSTGIISGTPAATGVFSFTVLLTDSSTPQQAVTKVLSITVANPSASITLVQKATNITSTAQNLSATLPSTVTAGNLIVVSVSGWPNLPAATPVTDSLGNTYSIAGTVLVFNGAYSAIYYAKNIRGGTNTVTFNTVKSGGQISMAVAEFSGGDTVSPLDRTAGTVGSGTAPSSGNMTPSLAGDLVIGSGTHAGNTVTTAGSGFTMIAIPTEDSNTHQPLAMDYQVLSGSQAVSATFKLGTGYPWTQNGALFKHR
jgi:hypothetical protein